MNNRHDSSFKGMFVLLGAALLLATPAVAQSPANKPRQQAGAETVMALPDLNITTAGEPLIYLSTPDPVISSDILTLPPGGVTRWMTHPNPEYVYVLLGDLTVQFADGTKKTFHQGEALLQPRTVWRRGRIEGKGPLRFLAVAFGAKGVPAILHPPGDSMAAN
jgi:quercetin dioxygenase-like cupin family protein